MSPPVSDAARRATTTTHACAPTDAAGVLLGWGLAGLVGGWLLRPLAGLGDGTAPIVTWLQLLALFLVAAILGATAWATWRTVHVHGQRLEPHRAVNRLVLARACALVGALAAGGYLGYALSWVGDRRPSWPTSGCCAPASPRSAAADLRRRCCWSAPAGSRPRGRRVAPRATGRRIAIRIRGVGNMRHRTHIVTRVSGRSGVERP